MPGDIFFASHVRVVGQRFCPVNGSAILSSGIRKVRFPGVLPCRSSLFEKRCHVPGLEGSAMDGLQRFLDRWTLGVPDSEDGRLHRCALASELFTLIVDAQAPIHPFVDLDSTPSIADAVPAREQLQTTSCELHGVIPCHGALVLEAAGRALGSTRCSAPPGVDQTG